MTLIRNYSKQDPAKDAIYNPKEFRGRRFPPVVAPETGGRIGAMPRLVALLVIIGMIGWYLWSKYFSEPAIRAPAYISSHDAVLAPAIIPQTQVLAPPPVPQTTLPSTGDVQRLRQEPPGTAYAPLKLFGNRNGKHCMLLLEDWETGVPVLAVFVRSGDVTESPVPLGQYRGKIACGSTWHGTQLFGQATTINQLVAPIVFTRNETGGVRGMMIEMTARLGGNLKSHQQAQLL